MWEYLVVPLIAFGLPALLIALRWTLPRIIDLLIPPDPEPVIELPDEKAEWDAAFLKATGKRIYPRMTPCDRHHQYVIGRRECVMCGHLSTTYMPPVETGHMRATYIPAEHMYRMDISDSMTFALIEQHKKDVADTIARELDRALKTGIALHE